VTYLTRLSKGFGTTLWAKLHYRRQKKTEEERRRRQKKRRKVRFLSPRSGCGYERDMQ
jgi:hypothetical protein